MVSQIIEQIELLHSAGSTGPDTTRAPLIDKALAHCLQELRAIAATQARDHARRAPLRVV